MTEKNPPSNQHISPCKQICKIDQKTRLCTGCGRTLEEIGKWSKMTYFEQMEIMKRLGFGVRRKR